MKLPLPSDAPPTLALAPSQSAMQLIRAGTMRRLASKRSSFRTRSISVTLPTVGGTPPVVSDAQPAKEAEPSSTKPAGKNGDLFRKHANILKNALRMRNLARRLPLHTLPRVRQKGVKGGTNDDLAAMWSLLQAGRDENGPAMALPTAADLRQLPSQLQETFYGLAMETLRKYLRPRALLWLKKKERKRLMATSTCPPLTPQVLTRQELFKACPVENLRDILDKLVLTVVEKDEILIHEGEQAGSGIFFIMTGTVAVYKKKDRSSRSIGPSNGTLLARLTPVVCVGEFTFLTEEPRMASITALTKVECWVLRKNDFQVFVSKLPENKMANIIECAFAQRNNTMHMSYPVTEAMMQQCSIFQPCNPSLLKVYLRLLTPYAVPKNFHVVRGEVKCDRILFLVNGRCGVLRPVTQQRRDSSRTKHTSLVHVHTLKAPCVIGDTAILHGTMTGDSIMTLSTCDFWVLSRPDFFMELRKNPGVELDMMAAAREQRQMQLATQQNLFRDCICDIPFLRDLLPQQAMRDLVQAFEARVYKPLSVVCSTAEFANRLIVLYKGKIRVDNSYWKKGECVGFTCLIPHKWARMAVSREVAECLELDLDVFTAFLKKWNIYNDMLKLSKLLMFPLAFDSTQVGIAQEAVVDLKTPPLYPISSSLEFKLSESGFNGVHYSRMMAPQEVKVPEKRDWTRVSFYLWRRPPPAVVQTITTENNIIVNLRHAGRKLPRIGSQYTARGKSGARDHIDPLHDPKALDH